jgi:hypothetical protein
MHPDPQPAAPDDEEDPLPSWAFLLVFLAPPLLMSFVSLLAVYAAGLIADPLAIALTIGHLITACALFATYRAFKKRSSES